jgi:Ca-activated chloride channel family protein
MTFQSPYWLFALLVVPAVLVAYAMHERRRTRYAARFATPTLLPNVVDRAPGRRRYVPPAILIAGLVAMIVGVARPHATVSVRREEATVMLAIDTSRSMQATDVKPTRLGAALIAAEAFLKKVPEKFRVGVVSFASRAVVTLPPTTNRDLVKDALASLRPGEGTALGDAVALSVQVARRQRTSDGTVPPTSVLVISDGARDGGKTPPQTAARRAKALRIPVYTIVLGTPGGTVERRLTGGYTEIIRVPPSPQTLQRMAQTTGGQSFSVASDSRLRDVYEKLGSRLGSRNEDREITDLFAGGAAVLLLTGGALSALWFRRVA